MPIHLLVQEVPVTVALWVETPWQQVCDCMKESGMLHCEARSNKQILLSLSGSFSYIQGFFILPITAV